MLVKLLCFLWGHKTTVYAQDYPAIITDDAIFKHEPSRYLFEPRSINWDISLVMLPPNMKASDAFVVGPTINRCQRLPFCVRCGEIVNKKAKTIAVGELVGND